MNRMYVDAGWTSANKFGQLLCGDRVELHRQEDGGTTLVLADGLGSGVKANILATLTSKIIGTMMAGGMSVEDCVAAMAATLPICRERGIAYSTFTILHLDADGCARVIEYDNPKTILLRDGKSLKYEVSSRTISGKTVTEAEFRLREGDMFVTMSDGAIYAGVGKSLNFGWQRENIMEFIEANYEEDCSSKMLSSLLVDECSRLYRGEPGDDTTVAALKLWPRRQTNLMIGPPADPGEVPDMMSRFFSQEGKHIVCGGTTSILASQFLRKDIRTRPEYLDPEIPPTAEIDGVDLVTEGVITVSRVLRYAKEYLEGTAGYPDWSRRRDGASRISRLLFAEATDIQFFVGRAVNPAHQNPDLPVAFRIKIQLVDELAECLRKMGKRVKVSYF